MPSPNTDGKTKGDVNISDIGPRFGSTKLAIAIIRGTLTLAVIGVLVLVAARPAQGQTESVLYNFTGGSDGGDPQSSLTFDAAGNLYGTTHGGGWDMELCSSFRRMATEVGMRPCSTASLEGRTAAIQVTLM
jgi:hypothetical protein